MFAIGLDNPGNAINVGHVLRAADAFGAVMVAITGNCRVKSVTDTSGAAFKIPVVRGTSLHGLIPHNCVPVAVELLDNAEDLCEFVHPRNAFYVFGSEGATLGRRVVSWCKHVVYVPTRICLNLSACVNIVCYDRLLKERIEMSMAKLVEKKENVKYNPLRHVDGLMYKAM